MSAQSIGVEKAKVETSKVITSLFKYIEIKRPLLQ